MRSARGPASRGRLQPTVGDYPVKRLTRSQARAALQAQPGDADNSRPRRSSRPNEDMSDLRRPAPSLKRKHRLSSLSRDSPLVDVISPRRPVRVRKSLMHPSLRELDLGRRMGMLREVAEDYILKVLKSNSDDVEDAQELQRTWDGLQGWSLLWSR